MGICHIIRLAKIKCHLGPASMPYAYSSRLSCALCIKDICHGKIGQNCPLGPVPMPFALSSMPHPLPWRVPGLGPRTPEWLTLTVLQEHRMTRGWLLRRPAGDGRLRGCAATSDKHSDWQNMKTGLQRMQADGLVFSAGRAIQEG